MADLGFGYFVRYLRTNADLNGVNTIFFESFDLSDLAAVHLDDSAPDHGSPLIPEMGTADLEANNTCTLAIPTRWLCRLQF